MKSTPMKNEKVIVISCSVLREQIEAIGPPDYEYMYLEQGLHRTPNVLREDLQKAIDESRNYDFILLGYGLCSRAMTGLQARKEQTLIIPRIDDCIGLSLGARLKYYEEFEKNPGTYYFTRGWIEAAEDPLKEYHKTLAKYGKEIAEWTAFESLKHYRRTVLIRTDSSDDEPSKLYVRNFAQFFNLQYEEIFGSLDYVKKLLFGPWDEDFVIVKNGKITSDEMFLISSCSTK